MVIRHISYGALSTIVTVSTPALAPTCAGKRSTLPLRFAFARRASNVLLKPLPWSRHARLIRPRDTTPCFYRIPLPVNFQEQK
jgi:hypothetical protein